MKIKTALVLKGMFSKATYVCVPKYQISSFQPNSNEFQTGGSNCKPLPLTSERTPKTPTQIRVNLVNKCVSELCEPLKHVFYLSIETGMFQDKLKVACVSPLYKAGDSSHPTNYRLISVHTFFFNKFLFLFSSNLQTLNSKF